MLNRQTTQEKRLTTTAASTTLRKERNIKKTPVSLLSLNLRKNISIPPQLDDGLGVCAIPQTRHLEVILEG
jgi:hypothetical protein